MSNIKNLVHEDFTKLKDNKEEYFNNFYNNNYNLVYRICYSILKNKENSEDTAQNVFEKIYKMETEKMPEQYESSWLYTVAKNEALQFIRKNKISAPEEELENTKSNDNEVEDIIDKKDYDEIVKKLGKKQEQIVSLKVISDFTFKEIGQIMSMPTATVQWHYYSSMKYLKLAISNFAMFLIAFVIGIRALNNEGDNTNKSEDKKGTNKVNTDNDKVDNDNDKVSIDEDNKFNSESIENIANSIIANDSTSQVDTSKDIMEATSVSNNVQEKQSNVYKGLFGVAGAFLIISVIFSIFFIKYQQKLNNKTSKK